MPIFSYQCRECGHNENDKMVKKWDDEIPCPVCNKIMEKKPSAFGFSIEPAVPRGS